MSEENKAILRRYFDEGLNQENLALFDQIMAPDFANHSPRLGIMTREETVQDFARIFRAFPDRRSTIEDIISEDDKVFVRTTVQGTHADKVPGILIDPTGKQITWSVWEVFRFAGDRIVERWGIHNLREQLETVAEPGRDER